MWKADHAIMRMNHSYRSLQDNPQLFVSMFKEHSDLDCKDLFKICQINQNNDRNQCSTMLYNLFRAQDPIIWKEINDVVPIQKQFKWRCSEYRSFLEARKLIEYLQYRALWLRNFVDTNSDFRGAMDNIISDNDDSYIQDPSGDNFAIRKVTVKLFDNNNVQPENTLEVSVTSHEEGDFKYIFDFDLADFESNVEDPEPQYESMNSQGDDLDQAALRLAKHLHSWLHQASNIKQMSSVMNMTNLLTFSDNQPTHLDWEYNFDITGTPNGQIAYIKVNIPIL